MLGDVAAKLSWSDLDVASAHQVFFGFFMEKGSDILRSVFIFILFPHMQIAVTYIATVTEEQTHKATLSISKGHLRPHTPFNINIGIKTPSLSVGI